MKLKCPRLGVYRTRRLVRRPIYAIGRTPRGSRFSSLHFVSRKEEEITEIKDVAQAKAGPDMTPQTEEMSAHFLNISLFGG